MIKILLLSVIIDDCDDTSNDDDDDGDDARPPCFGKGVRNYISRSIKIILNIQEKLRKSQVDKSVI